MSTSGKLPIASVSELLTQVKSLVNETFDFVAVRGAITNFSSSSSAIIIYHFLTITLWSMPSCFVIVRFVFP